jgi:hypothetical protein
MVPMETRENVALLATQVLMEIQEIQVLRVMRD